MALEQFRTQVLLLHSQQSTLDALGAGFNDRYSIHFATSGSEALTTLGETPINILVSAQELPGMSGLEALREARKRSPDTIGILLAGDDDGLEALVGDQEVFQIVRGEVTPEALQKVVENAARRMRMLTISRSANDTAADVDEPGEHIIMETAENGSSLISDGTGRLPVLKPERIQAVPDASVRKVDVLVLTRDSEFLETIRQSTHGLHNVHHATTAQQSQDAVRNHPVGVLVTDAAIAGSKVELLIQKLRDDAPRLIAVVAGRRDDGEMLMNLINRGQVYRFLLKPVSPGRARLAIEASAKHHLEAPDGAFRGAAASAAQPASPPPARQQPAAAKPAPKDNRPAPQPRRPAAAARPAPAAPSRARPAADAGDALARTTTNATALSETVAAAAAESGRFQRDRLATMDGTADSGPNRLPFIGAAAAAVLLLGIGGWFLLGGSDDPVLAVGDPLTEAAEPPAEASGSRPAITESDVPVRRESPPAADVTAAPSADAAAATQPVVEPVVRDDGTDANPGTAAPVAAGNTAAPATRPAEDSGSAAPEPAHIALLDNARVARDAGRLLQPAADNAVDWYVAARDAAPDNAAIAAELDTLIERVFGMAEQALLENRTADAALALDKLAAASPANPRLGFLNAQLAQLELRAALDNARNAIREARFEDAARQITRAQAIPGADMAQIDQLTEDLAAARSAQQIDDVLAQAATRLGEGSLTEPPNDNARYFYELALSSDAGNVAAEQGLLTVASKLVLSARTAIDAGELDRARQFLADARELDPESGELAAAAAALETALEQQAEAERLAAAARQAAALAAEEQRIAEQRRRAATATLSTSDSPAGSTPAVPDASAIRDEPAGDGTSGRCCIACRRRQQRAAGAGRDQRLDARQLRGAAIPAQCATTQHLRLGRRRVYRDARRPRERRRDHGVLARRRVRRRRDGRRRAVAFRPGDRGRPGGAEARRRAHVVQPRVGAVAANRATPAGD
ncbi:MAG: hypothetical protein U5K76_02430 [Woeseiaceae bacterium]|nr:hypothetical protein [Woeseiaceae bacterium]